MSVTKLNICKGYNAQVVELLTELLQKAKEGELLSFIATFQGNDGLFQHYYTGCDDLFKLVGELERQKYVCVRRMEE